MLEAPGPAQSFDALYEEHFERVWAYAVSRVGRQLAEDVVSQTFAVAWRRLDRVPPDPLPWLIGVCRNVVRERCRDGRRQELIQAELASWAATAAQVEGDLTDSVTSRAMLLRALARIPEGDRELLTLVAWHGLSTREAADVLGCSRPALLVRLHRARARLERALGVGGGGCEESGALAGHQEVSTR